MNFIATIEADGAAALAEVKAGLTYLEAEGKAVIAWVEKEVPGSAGAIAAFLTSAEADAASLARIAASGLSGQIAAGGDAMQTFLLNLVSSTGFGVNVQSGLKSIDAGAISLLESIGKGLVSTGLAALLAKLAPAAAPSAATAP
ncbi:MAG TPA: hypothetical protein VII63_08470 [Caulobacteraceae bacterium]